MAMGARIRSSHGVPQPERRGVGVVGLGASATSRGRNGPRRRRPRSPRRSPPRRGTARRGSRPPRRARRARPPPSRPRPTSRGSPGGSSGRRRAARRRRASSSTRPSSRRTRPARGTRARAPATRAPARSPRPRAPPDARDGAHPPAAEARDEHPGEPAREQPADRQRGDRGPELGVRQPEPVPDLRQPRQDDATSTPLAKNSVLTAIRADRARAALTEGIIGRLWCPSSRGARRGACPIVSTMPELPEVETVARDLRRRLLPDGGGRPGDHRRARRLAADAAGRGPGTVRGGRRGPAGRGDRAARQAADRRPLRRARS